MCWKSRTYFVSTCPQNYYWPFLDNMHHIQKPWSVIVLWKPCAINLAPHIRDRNTINSSYFGCLVLVGKPHMLPILDYGIIVNVGSYWYAANTGPGTLHHTARPSAPSTHLHVLCIQRINSEIPAANYISFTWNLVKRLFMTASQWLL